MLLNKRNLYICRRRPRWPVRSVGRSCCRRTWKHIFCSSTLKMTWTARCAPCLVSPLMSCAFTSVLHIQTTVQSLRLAACFHLTLKLLKTGLTAAPGPLEKQRKIQMDRVQLGNLHSSPQHWKHRTQKQDGRFAENVLKMILKQWNLSLYQEVTQIAPPPKNSMTAYLSTMWRI